MIPKRNTPAMYNDRAVSVSIECMNLSEECQQCSGAIHRFILVFPSGKMKLLNFQHLILYGMYKHMNNVYGSVTISVSGMGLKCHLTRRIVYILIILFWRKC